MSVLICTPLFTRFVPKLTSSIGSCMLYRHNETISYMTHTCIPSSTRNTTNKHAQKYASVNPLRRRSGCK
jgi:chemotaxis receptor (MCP) glutamine deamidase CheD